MACFGIPAAGAQAGTANVTFGTGEHQFVVPAGVTSVNVVAVGAPGGGPGTAPGNGGRGAQVTADLPMQPGETYYLLVGGKGNATIAAGGGGGGASDVRTKPGSAGINPDPRILIAAGGGGSGAPSGGAGGDANQPGVGAGTAGGGQAGVPVGTGAGGINTNGPWPGTAGSLGFGGTGYGGPLSDNGGAGGFNGGGNGGEQPAGASAGGGGGGGLNGGGGGAGSPGAGSAAGGGGGSNLVPAGGTATIDASRNPRITVVFADDTPPVVTLDAPPEVTSNNRPTFSGTPGHGLGDVAMDGTPARIDFYIYAGGSAAGPPVRSLLGEPKIGGNYAISQEYTPLPEGQYTAQAEQVDSAGNVGKSPARTFEVDRTAPAISIAEPSARARINTATPAITGTAGFAAHDDASVEVRIFAGLSVTDTTPVKTLTGTRDATTGAYSLLSSKLPDGEYTAVALQSDAVKNNATSASRTFTIDTVAPTPALTTPLDQARSQDVTPTFSGSGTTGAGDAGDVTVRVYAGDTASGLPVSTLTATLAAGTGAFTAEATAPLPAGSYTAQVTQLDVAGNVGQAASRRFTIDTTGPVPALVSPSDGASGVSTTPTFSGTASTAPNDGASVTITVHVGASTAGAAAQTITATRDPVSGAFSARAPFALAPGLYTAQASQADDVGNAGAGPAVTFEIGDATKPVVSGMAVKHRRLRFSLSEPARVDVAFRQRSHSGKPIAHALRHLRGKAGANSVRLPRGLRRGRCKIVIVARDAFGNRSKTAVLKVKVKP
jgi:hypothetical protein